MLEEEARELGKRASGRVLAPLKVAVDPPVANVAPRQINVAFVNENENN